MRNVRTDFTKNIYIYFEFNSNQFGDGYIDWRLEKNIDEYYVMLLHSLFILHWFCPSQNSQNLRMSHKFRVDLFSWLDFNFFLWTYFHGFEYVYYKGGQW